MNKTIGIIDSKQGDDIKSSWTSHIDVSELATMEAYALMTACVGEIQKRLKGYNYIDNRDTNVIINFVRDMIITPMIKYHRAIIPLGIKTLILAETEAVGRTRLIKRLLVDENITKSMVNIISRG